LVQDLKDVYNTLWRGISWVGQVPEGWKKVMPMDNYLKHCPVSNDEKYPGKVFVFCDSSSGRHVPGSFFLQAVTMRHMQKAIISEKLTNIVVPNVFLVALETKENIKSMSETEQAYLFVLVLDMKDTVMPEKSLSNQAIQEIAKLCCLGFPVSYTFWSHSTDGQLLVIEEKADNREADNEVTKIDKAVVMTRPLSCFVLREPATFKQTVSANMTEEEKEDLMMCVGQYARTRQLIHGNHVSRLGLAKFHLEHMSKRVESIGCFSYQTSSKDLSPSDKIFRETFETVLYELNCHITSLTQNSGPSNP